MRPITSVMAQSAAESQVGPSLYFERCKGGYFSTREEYALTLSGATSQASLSGKNLIDREELNVYENWSNTQFAYGSYGSLPLNAIYLLPCTAGQPYTLSIARGEQTPGYLYLCAATSTQTRLVNTFTTNQYESLSKTFTPSEGETYYLRLAYYTPRENFLANIAKIEGIQLERSAVQTPYEPYCGGIPVPNPDYPQPIRCVKAGTTLRCGESTVTLPCDLYEEDVWYPASGRVERRTGLFTFGGANVFSASGTSAQSRTPAGSAPGVVNSATTLRPDFGSLDLIRAANDAGYLFTTAERIGHVFPDIDALNAYLAQRASSGNPAKLLYRRGASVWESYAPQLLRAPGGVVTLTQEPEELVGTLRATMPVRRDA